MENVTKVLPRNIKFEGMSQYRPPLNFELVGKQFELAMDTGCDYVLDFLDRKTLIYGPKDGKMNSYTYDCLKGDDDTYFVNFEVVGASPRAGLTFVIDMEQYLVTACYCTVGQNPRYPKMPKTTITFGAIKRPDGTLNPVRHGYTSDFAGNSIAWNYGPFTVVHIYSSERYYRLDFSDEDNARRAAEGVQIDPEEQKRREEHLYEEPTDCIKIKDGIYVFSMTEEMGNRTRGQGNNLFFLMNLDRMYDVGRSFGHNGDGEPENYTYGAYGKYADRTEIQMKPSTEYIR